MPRLTAIHTDANYLHRQTPLFGIVALASLVNADIVRRQFIPMLQTLSQDRVPNIRMNVSRAIQALKPYLIQQQNSSQDIIVSDHPRLFKPSMVLILILTVDLGSMPTNLVAAEC